MAHDICHPVLLMMFAKRLSFSTEENQKRCMNPGSLVYSDLSEHVNQRLDFYSHPV